MKASDIYRSSKYESKLNFYPDSCETLHYKTIYLCLYYLIQKKNNTKQQQQGMLRDKEKYSLKRQNEDQKQIWYRLCNYHIENLK